jgi:glycosyltransferase AglI
MTSVVFHDPLVNPAPLLSVVVPVRDDVEGLRTTLESLRIELGARTDVEVTVAIDGESSDVCRMAETFGFATTTLPHPVGSYAARNAGIRSSRGRNLAFLDADQRVGPGWIDSGVQSLEEADYVGGAVDVLLGRAHSAWESFDQLTAFPVRRYVTSMHFAPTANLFVRRSVFETVGMFHDCMQSGGDREFGVRVYKAGLLQAYCDAARTLHPARSKRAQLAKQSRVARGVVHLRVGIWDQSPWVVLLSGIGHCMVAAAQPIYKPFQWRPRTRSFRMSLLFSWMSARTRFRLGREMIREACRVMAHPARYRCGCRP